VLKHDSPAKNEEGVADGCKRINIADVDDCIGLSLGVPKKAGISC